MYSVFLQPMETSDLGKEIACDAIKNGKFTATFEKKTRIAAGWGDHLFAPFGRSATVQKT